MGQSQHVKYLQIIHRYFSKVKDETFSDIQLSNDLNKISKWNLQQKMCLNPDPSKQAIEIYFSHKHDENYRHLCLMTPRYNSLLARNIQD